MPNGTGGVATGPVGANRANDAFERRGGARVESWSTEVAEPIARVVARVRARRSELASAVTEAVRRYPGYRELAGDDVAKLEAGVAVSVDLLTGLFETGRLLAPSDLAAMRPLGAQRARQGVPLADVLAGVAAGIARAWQFFANDAAELECGRERVFDAVDPWFSEVLAAATEAMARGYLEERKPRSRAASPRAAVLVEMLSGVVDDAHAVGRGAPVTAWDHRSSYGLVLFTAPTAAPVAPSVLDAALAEWMGSMAGAIGGGRHLDPVPHAVTVACVPPGGWGDATAVASLVGERRGLVALVSDDTVDVGDVQRLYRSLSELLCLGAAVARAPGAVTPESLAVFRLVAAIPGPDRDATLGRLVARLRELEATPAGRELIDTAETVADFAGVANAAVALGVDPRTVGRRLARLEERLGVSLSARSDRLLLELALHAMRISGQATSPDGRFRASTAISARDRA